MSAVLAAHKRLLSQLPVREHRIHDDAHQVRTGGTKCSYAVRYAGTVYRSIAAAAKAAGVSAHKMQCMIDAGEAELA